MENELVKVTANALPATVTAVNQIKERMNLVTTIYRDIMVESHKETVNGKEIEISGDYGKVPGCGDKPTLLKPGAEKLMMAFKIAADAEKVEVENLGGGHRDYRVTVSLTGPGGEILGGGVGSCSTMESKYRYRSASRKCPVCGKETIIKGKEQFGGGWLCYQKKGGCGAKWQDGAHEIEQQETGKIENLDPADQWNTCLKMAKKRALIDACLTSLGASTMFTQDIEDMVPTNGPAVNQEPPKQTTPEQKKTFTNRDRYEAGIKAATPEQAVIIKAIAEKVATEENTPVADFNEAQYGRLLEALREHAKAAKQERKAA